ncbi:MAG TPA: AmmeMemoRadiSam system protein A [Acidimicrobiia bacterium]|nr:AmmeMemoRadiSam system protein A [Acidimicrobiia bacterium]
MTTTTALRDTDRRALLEVSTAVVGDVVNGRRPRLPDPAAFDGPLRELGASFVTLERGGQLLGCIGTLVAVQPLVVDVARHALDAAFADPRLPPVTRDDFAQMSVKVSVLSPPEPMAVSTFDELVAAVRPGIDGVLVDDGRHRATLLPSVWDHLPVPERFVEALWQKAGLARGAWPAGMAVSRYATEEFGDPGPRPPDGSGSR